MVHLISSSTRHAPFSVDNLTILIITVALTTLIIARPTRGPGAPWCPVRSSRSAGKPQNPVRPVGSFLPPPTEPAVARTCGLDETKAWATSEYKNPEMRNAQCAVRDPK